MLSTSLYDAGDETDGERRRRRGRVRQGASRSCAAIDNEAALGKALFAFGRYKAETGDIADGKDMLRDALAVFSQLGLAKPAQDVRDVLAKLG